ncbi:hypothetical protein BE17_38525 [Sorangium cellulosum]|uniref:Uncharacterized protein n=1 Tax=Sorangium cellulosum TaxID=56 RepID=A0A150RKL2_SORCE|nr:hypothetical protein BE17_38525 [Sorangium cellulosum]
METNRLFGAMRWAAVVLGLAGRADQDEPHTAEGIEESSAGLGETGTPASGRNVYGDGVALVQVYVYNRFRLYLEQLTYMLSNGQRGLFRLVPR